jgi:hypothetical protein
VISFTRRGQQEIMLLVKKHAPNCHIMLCSHPAARKHGVETELANIKKYLDAFAKQKTCPRCGKPFLPDPESLTNKFCVACQFRNLTDGLDMPMPPEMLDKHTKHPTLSQREYRQKLNGISPKHHEMNQKKFKSCTGEKSQ